MVMKMMATMTMTMLNVNVNGTELNVNGVVGLSGLATSLAAEVTDDLSGFVAEADAA